MLASSYLISFNYPTMYKTTNNSNRIIRVESHLSDVVMRLLRRVAQIAEKSNQPAYLVGGLVRDIIMGCVPSVQVPDITVVGDEIDFAQRLITGDRLGKIISKSRHHTVKLNTEGVTVEIASARKDIYNPWGALPRISLVDSIDADLPRRDFTINAMAISMNQNRFGVLIDPFNGAKHCTDRILHVLHTDSFREDPIRIMRGIRLAARYDLIFGEETEMLMRRDAERVGKLASESPARIFNEFRLWFLAHENTSGILELAKRFGILNEIARCISLDDSIIPVLRSLQSDMDALSRFAVLASQIPYHNALEMAERLRMSKDWRDVLEDAAKLDEKVAVLKESRISDSEVARVLREFRIEAVNAAMVIASDETVRSHIRRYISESRHIKPSCSGTDLISMGASGANIGLILDEIRDALIDGKVRNSEEELRYARQRVLELEQQH